MSLLKTTGDTNFLQLPFLGQVHSTILTCKEVWQKVILHMNFPSKVMHYQKFNKMDTRILT